MIGWHGKDGQRVDVGVPDGDPSRSSARMFAGESVGWRDKGISTMLMPCSSTISLRPVRNSTANGSENAYESRSESNTPTAPALPISSVRPAASGPAYPISSALARMRRRRCADNWSGRLYALEIVDGDTPTRRPPGS